MRLVLSCKETAPIQPGKGECVIGMKGSWAQPTSTPGRRPLERAPPSPCRGISGGSGPGELNRNSLLRACLEAGNSVGCAGTLFLSAAAICLAALFEGCGGCKCGLKLVTHSCGIT